jgi:hypothetical protein
MKEFVVTVHVKLVKRILCSCETAEQARKNPYAYLIDETEDDQLDYEVIDVQENKWSQSITWSARSTKCKVIWDMWFISSDCAMSIPKPLNLYALPVRSWISMLSNFGKWTLRAEIPMTDPAQAASEQWALINGRDHDDADVRDGFREINPQVAFERGFEAGIEHARAWRSIESAPKVPHALGADLGSAQMTACLRCQSPGLGTVCFLSRRDLIAAANEAAVAVRKALCIELATAASHRDRTQRLQALRRRHGDAYADRIAAEVARVMQAWN